MSQLIFSAPRTQDLEKVSEEIDRGIASFFLFFGWMAAALQLQILRAHSLPWSNLASNRRGMSARASGRHGGPEFGASDRRHWRTGGTLFWTLTTLSLPPISPRTGEINGRQAQSLIVAGRRSTYCPLLASVFNVQPPWVHLANHNSSASPHRSGSWKKCKCCTA